jgi:hypothetical protein
MRTFLLLLIHSLDDYAARQNGGVSVKQARREVLGVLTIDHLRAMYLHTAATEWFVRAANKSRTW